MAKDTRHRPKIYYGWVMVAAMISIGATTMAVAGPTFGFFIEPMQEDLGFDRSLFGWANTGRMLASALLITTKPPVRREQAQSVSPA